MKPVMKTLMITLALAAAPGLAACVSVLPSQVAPTALIALPADRAVAPSAPLQADVAVFMPEASRAFSGADIAVRDRQELVYLSDVQWSDSGPSLLQGAVINSLSKARGPGRAVPGQMGAETDYDLRWRVVDLSVGRQKAPVRVEVQASLMESATRRVIAQKSFVAEGAPDDASSRARAAALALTAQKAADDVAAFLSETIAVRKQANPRGVSRP